MKIKRKIGSIFLSMLLISTVFSYIAVAGDYENPEIEDETEEDVVDYLDIISAWFYEESGQPEYLFIGLKISEINSIHLKQHLTVHWDYKGIPCAAGMHIGYGDPWFSFAAGWGHGFWFQEHYEEVEGEYDEETGIIIIKIPKNVIKNPQAGDVLTNTYALTFQRFGFIGRLGFDRAILQSILFLITGKNRVDVGPNEEYGMDYIIQY